MEKTLLQALRELDKRYPDYANVRDLIQEGYSLDILSDGVRDGVIHCSSKSRDGIENIPNNSLIKLSASGLALLNQVDLKNSIVKFNESSDNFSAKLSNYTYLLLVFTMIIAMASLVSMYSYVKDGIVPIDSFYAFLFVFVVAYLYFGLMQLWHRKKAS